MKNLNAQRRRGRRKIINCTLFVLCILFFSCERRPVNHEDTEVNEVETALPNLLWEHALKIASALDDRLLASQVLISGIGGRGSLPVNIREMLLEAPPGGVMLFRFNLDTGIDYIRSLTDEIKTVITNNSSSLIKNCTGIPPFIAVDFEGGTVNRFRGHSQLPAASVFPAASNYWELKGRVGKQQTLEIIEMKALEAGREIALLGINMNFAPVVEFLNDYNREFLISRSYGPDPLFTAEASAAFIRGMRDAGILCTAKHFPSSAGADPHYYISVIEAEKEFLEKLAFPFKHLIQSYANLRAIMISHTALPAIDSEIASLSSLVMKDWLRGELGFNGLIIADDFIMAAAGGTRPDEAAVLSIIAGVDMVMVWPQDLLRTRDAILTALQNGKLPRERLENAVTRVLYEKLQMGMISNDG